MRAVVIPFLPMTVRRTMEVVRCGTGLERRLAVSILLSDFRQAPWWSTAIGLLTEALDDDLTRTLEQVITLRSSTHVAAEFAARILTCGGVTARDGVLFALCERCPELPVAIALGALGPRASPALVASIANAWVGSDIAELREAGAGLLAPRRPKPPRGRPLTPAQ